MRKSNNKGFSIIELIIVVAIIAVLMTLAGLSISYLNLTSRKQACNNIVSYIGKAQTYAMSKSNTYGVCFEEKSGKLTVSMVYRESETDPWTDVSDTYTVNKTIPFVIQTTNGDYDMNDGSDSTVVMTFDRTSGAFNELYCDGTLIADGQVTKILVGNDRAVSIVWRTGKYSIE